LIDVTLDGLEDVLAAIRDIPSSLDTRTVFSDVSQKFSARLRAATPKGYSGKLRDSVVFYSDEDGAEVGFEAGVETSGDPSLDSVLKPKTRGRSVLKRWVQPEELESVLEETFDGFSEEAVTIMTGRFVRGLS
jgi:hypothetical protein